MVEALLRQCYSAFGEYHEAMPRMSADVLTTVLSSRDPGYLADYIAQNINLRHQDKQAILEELQPLERLKNLNGILARELEVLSIEQELEHVFKLTDPENGVYRCIYCDTKAE